jgi:hypothetical protein
MELFQEPVAFCNGVLVNETAGTRGIVKASVTPTLDNNA